MRVLLVRPPRHDPRLALPYGAEPLALETVAGALDDCDLLLLDLQFATESIEEALARFSPDVVAATGYTADAYRVNALLRASKQHDDRILTVVGGHHATVAPGSFSFPWIDAIVLGMGERTLRELVQRSAEHRPVDDVRGLALPRDGRLSFTEPRPGPQTLDDTPVPRRDLEGALPERYRLFGEPFALVNTARGCPHRCNFCSVQSETKGRYLTKSAERILSELAGIEAQLVRFADGNTFGDVRRMRTLQERIRAAGLRKRFVFDVRADTIVANARLMESWRDVGLEYVAVGFEAVHDRRLASLNKATTVAENERAISILHQNGIRIVGQFMVDPDFGEEDFDGLLAFVQRHRIDLPKFTVTTPLPGTPLFRQEESRLTTRDYRRFDTMHAVLPTRLPQQSFEARFLELYARCYGSGAGEGVWRLRP
jgi:radical SAM superfamily enzyme YgiQ (UPF0313 family)